jgi:hypothetical protein
MTEPRPDTAASAAPEKAGLVPLSAEWMESVSERLGASAQLVMAETRLAASTFLLMIFLVILAGGAALFAWALLMLALGQALSLAGLSLVAAIGLLGAVHLALAWVLWNYANRLGRYLEFRNTRRLLGS